VAGSSADYSQWNTLVTCLPDIKPIDLPFCIDTKSEIGFKVTPGVTVEFPHLPVGLAGLRQAIMTKRIERAEAIVRMVLRLFQGPSNRALSAAISSMEADCRGKAERRSLSGTLPKKVTPNVPAV
jgi:hypothetical protein